MASGNLQSVSFTLPRTGKGEGGQKVQTLRRIYPSLLIMANQIVRPIFSVANCVASPIRSPRLRLLHQVLFGCHFTNLQQIMGARPK